MRRALLLLLCACGHAGGPRATGEGVVATGAGATAVERMLLAAAGDPRRGGPIARPRVPRELRTIESLDRRISATERGLAGISQGDAAEPVLLLELAAVHAERAVVLRAAGQMDTSDERALALVRRLTSEDRFRGFERVDEALLLLAEICERRGEVEAMQAAYLRLIGEFSGQYIPGAYLAFADRYYAVGKIHDAREMYEKVLTFSDSPVHAYALYRLAWCDRVESPERAQDGFRRALAAAEAGQGGTPAEARVLRAAARRDLGRPPGP